MVKFVLFILDKQLWTNILDKFIYLSLFLSTHFQDVFETFSKRLRRRPKTVIYRRICLGHTSEKFMVIVQNLPE